MDDFEKELKLSFLEEALQGVQDTEQCFLTLEENPSDLDTINKIFRLAHNLKGSAKAVGFDHLGQFAHQYENLLIKIKNGEITVSSSIVSLLLDCNDQITHILNALKTDFSAQPDCSELLVRLEKPQNQGGTPSTKNTELPPIASKPKDLPKSEVQSDESIRVSLARVEKLLDYVGELVILQSVLKEQSLVAESQSLKRTIHQLGKVTKEVQDISMGLRMLPIKSSFQKMQRIVRDTAKALDKEVRLVLVGEETELDKSVLEKINDPLVHLVRNSVDHGIETPEIRSQSGKSPQGQVTLAAYHQGGKLIIEISDDGAGINPEGLRQSAIKKGIVKSGDHLSEQDCINLIFHPGFSTKQVTTDISGRGVGMDVVRSNLRDLSGDVIIDTEVGRGTTFKIVLPLTLAIIDGMVVRAQKGRFVLPLSHVHESVRVRKEEVRFVTNLGEVLLLRGENIPLYHLPHLLGQLDPIPTTNDQIAVIVRIGDQPMAVVVDDIIGQYQVVVKQLGAEAQRTKGFTGTTILGDGRPALILDVLELKKHFDPKRKSYPIAKEKAA